MDQHQSKRLSKRLDGRNVEVEDWQLLPGIPNEITVDKIGPKLPWTTFHILSGVNRRWREAIQRHDLLDARVRAQSTQTLITLHLRRVSSNDIRFMIALYSVNDGSCHLLPPVPGTPCSGNLLPCQNLHPCSKCISLDGKVYVLGGYKHSLADNFLCSSAVYVMDLVGQGQWKPCASMQDPRVRFGCGVINGKIYVFGGISTCRPVDGGRGVYRPVCGSEVYDPIRDAWSPIAPMLSFRYAQQVTVVGEELFVHSGRYIHSEGIYGRFGLDWTRNEGIDLHVTSGREPVNYSNTHEASFAEVYHPVKNEWRIEENFMAKSDNLNPKILMVEGKLHKITLRYIDVYNSHSNSWTRLQSCSFELGYPMVSVFNFDVVAMEDRIIALVRSLKGVDRNSGSRPIRLLRSQKLDDEHKENVWQEGLQCSLPPDCVLMSLSRCIIQL